MPQKTERQRDTDEILEMIGIMKVLEAFQELEDDEDDTEDAATEDDESIPISTMLTMGLVALHAQRYLNERRVIPKGNILSVLLEDWKTGFPDFFRSYLCVTPATFDALLHAIEDDPVFHNNSDTAEQLAVNSQLAVALYRFGHYGNGVSVRKVGLQLGLGFGTVVKSTRRVIAALCRDRVRKSAIRWPTNEEKEKAKEWVEEHSCPAWRDGWLMVDGTLVPLFARPGHFGNNWFDRKSNYSLNVQLITTPDLRIVDYGIGLPGSQHDATAWKMTRIPNEFVILLPNGEWIWADSAYPLQLWLMAPYKAPMKFEDWNEVFNYYVANVRVRSEHAVGYLKGRFCSLRGLRLRIDDQEHIGFATYWIIACMVVHNFAMVHERNIDMDADAFFLEGLQHVQAEAAQEAAADADARDIELAAAEERPLRDQGDAIRIFTYREY
ncbi:DDE Tnp4 domain-containing protein [Mycena indigotica]|uniref:DDE Tnp4 domain-containing protein n=1 Tax=Mycena indigotica TaxID=2126181 RepID=A0A8H6RZG8_9AGAR|nr:DDE Tnp4 domain-containing protein [Mycena indigotica]KAF7290164.1 DDE Tnp4 domain-containing protein [Mycena indigotica]